MFKEDGEFFPIPSDRPIFWLAENGAKGRAVTTLDPPILTEALFTFYIVHVLF